MRLSLLSPRPARSLLENAASLPENAVIVRSLTKELALPGLRMGYLIAPPSMSLNIAGIMPAWPLSAPSLAAAVAGMRDTDHVTEGARLARTHIGVRAGALSAAGLAPIPTHANYVLVRAPGVAGSLAALGVTVRDCSSFGLPDHVRIAAPMRSDLPQVIRAIERVPRG